MPRVLILFFSLSAQTSGLVHRFGSGLEKLGVEVAYERLTPMKPLRFPIGTIFATLAMMLITFCRSRVPIAPLSPACDEAYDLLVLAGPTWSYNPSGPVLSLIDRDGKRIFSGKTVLPLISCRGYWRLHWLGLGRLLGRCGAKVTAPMIFTHPSKEPWRTIGVFLKLAGRTPEKSRVLGKHYPRYGHSREQLEAAEQQGADIGRLLSEGRLDFPTSILR